MDNRELNEFTRVLSDFCRVARSFGIEYKISKEHGIKKIDNIKRCPRCGSAFLSIKQIQKPNRIRWRWSIECCTCHLESGTKLSRRGVIRSWNRLKNTCREF